MTNSPVARLAVALIAGAAGLALATPSHAQQTLPTEPTAPISPVEPIGPAPDEPSGTASIAHIPTEHLDAAHLQQSLRHQGYYDIHGIQRDGSHYRATAQKDGRPVELEIDARTGAVTPKRM
jgi:hypothetical protein